MESNDASYKLTQIHELGEFGLINHLTKHIRLHQSTTQVGVGDDAALIEALPQTQTLLTTDLLVEGVHFDCTYTPLKHLGYKAIVIGISDVVAMNGSPKQVLVSLGIPSRFTVEAVEELYKGLLIACEAYQLDLVGGDTTAAKQLTINITVVGEVNCQEAVWRNTAQTNDLICVTGDLGGAFVGLTVLEREKRIFLDNPAIQPDLEGTDYALKRQLRPEARTDLQTILKTCLVRPTSMIDLSDGLASDLIQLCKASNTGCKIYEEKIPIDKSIFNLARSFNLDPTICAMNGGEDYEILFTISQQDYEKIKNSPDITIVGHMTIPSEGYYLVTESGNVHEITAQGWGNEHLQHAPKED